MIVNWFENEIVQQDFKMLTPLEKSFKTRTGKWKGTPKGWPPKGADKMHPGWSGQK